MRWRKICKQLAFLDAAYMSEERLDLSPQDVPSREGVGPEPIPEVCPTPPWSELM